MMTLLFLIETMSKKLISCFFLIFSILSITFSCLHASTLKQKQIDPKQGSLTGIVRDEDGNILSNIRVEIRNRIQKATLYKFLIDKKEPGKYQFINLDEGEYDISAFDENLKKKCRNWGPEKIHIMAGCTIIKNITMEIPGIRIVFKDRCGNCIPRVKVELIRNVRGDFKRFISFGVKHSSAEGKVKFNLFPSDCNFQKFEYRIKFLEDESHYKPVHYRHSCTLTEKEILEGRVIEFRNLETLGKEKAGITGFVYKISDNIKGPLPKAEIKFEGQKYLADVHGRYKIDNIKIPQTNKIFTIKVGANSSGFMPEVKKVSLTPGCLVNMDFELKNLFPVVNGTILIYKEDSREPKRKFSIIIRESNLNFQRETHTDNKGKFSFQLLPPGVYRLEAKDTNGTSVFERDLNLMPNTRVSMALIKAKKGGFILGKIIDENGTPLPGIQVTLNSDHILGFQSSTVTNAEGDYRFDSLVPGTYKMTAQLAGFNKIVHEDISVNLGSAQKIDLKMSLSTISGPVVVTGTSSIIDSKGVAVSDYFDKEFLNSIPTGGGSNYYSIASNTLGYSVSGSSGGENTYTLDGINVCDAVIGSDVFNFNMDGIEEISVQTSGLSAEYGILRGNVVDVISGSGRNKISGISSISFTHESLQSNNTKGTDLYKKKGISEKTGLNLQCQPNVSLGGPFIKDRLWFFVNFSLSKKKEYIPGYPYDKAEGDADVPSDETRWMPYFKLTFQPSHRDQFMLFYKYNNTLGNHLGASRFYTVTGTRTQRSHLHIFNLNWERFFSPNVFSDLKFNFSHQINKLHAKQPGISYADYFSYFHTGSYWKNQDDTNKKSYQVKLHTTIFIDDFVGNHELKMGGAFQFLDKIRGVEIFSHSSNGVGYAVMAPEVFGNPGWYYGINFNDGFNQREQLLNIGFFFQDFWIFNNHLTLNLGIRYDYQSLIWPPQAQDQPMVWNPFGDPIDRSIHQRVIPIKCGEISPRLGLIYDFSNDANTSFKVSWAKYIKYNWTDLLNLAHPNGWFAYRVWLEQNTGSPIGYQPFWSPGSQVEIGYKDHPLSAPYSNELVIGFESEIWKDWVFSANYTRQWDRNLIYSVDANRLNMDALLDNNEFQWLGYTEKMTTDTFNGGEVIFYNESDPSRSISEYLVNPPDAKRDSDGIELSLNKNFTHGWSFNVSYKYQNSRGMFHLFRDSDILGAAGIYHNPNAHTNNLGRSPFERRHQIKVVGLIKGPWGINISGSFNHYSGLRWTRVVSSDFLGGMGYLNQGNETIYAEKRGSHAFPALNLLDLRVEKTFYMNKWKFKLYIDIFNLLNAKTSTSVRTNSSHPFYSYSETLDLVDPRVIRLGAKIQFN